MPRLKNHKVTGEQPRHKHTEPESSKNNFNDSSPVRLDVRYSGSFEQHKALLGDAGSGKTSDALQRATTVRQLQNSFGNRYVNRLLDQGPQRNSIGIQTKMTVGPSADKYEREADHVAKQVIGQINGTGEQSVQRQGIEEEELQMKPLGRQIGMEGGNVGPELEQSIEKSRGRGQALPENLRRSMEGPFGADFSGVRVHTDAQSHDINDSISARAFTTGQDIFFRKGEYNPGNDGGREILAHELTHVVQQGPGINLKQNENPEPKTLETSQQADTNVQRLQRAVDDEEGVDLNQMYDTEEEFGWADNPYDIDQKNVDASVLELLERVGVSDEDLGNAKDVPDGPTGKSTGLNSALSGASAAQGIGEKVADIANAGSKVGNTLGTLGGGLASLTGLKAMYDGYQEGGATGKAQMFVGATQTSLGIASALAASKIAEAAVAVPGIGLLVGAAQIIAGFHEGVVYEDREHKLKDLQGGLKNQTAEQARQMAEAASQTKKEGAFEKIAEGTGNVVGFAVLAAAGITNPVGLGIIAAAGLIAGGSAIVRKLDERAKGKAIVDKKEKEHQERLQVWKKYRSTLKAAADANKTDDVSQTAFEECEAWVLRMDDRIDRSTLSILPWKTGYAEIFRNEQKEQMKDVAKKLHGEAMADEPHPDIVKVINAMGYDIKPEAGEPNEDRIYNFFKAAIN